MRTPARLAIVGALFWLVGVSTTRAQQQPPAESKDSSAPSAPQPAAGAAPADQQNAPATPQAPKPTTPPAPYVHSFWDRENDWLFAGVAAGRAFDYASTLN
ncbi:MAG TPA: hypothetical protein VNZ56_15240, partial [Verrucomicrobiae bacterium]|nr:hypothetical protein [Verrucomicrobiae bacterium]